MDQIERNTVWQSFTHEEGSRLEASMMGKYIKLPGRPGVYAKLADNRYGWLEEATVDKPPRASIPLILQSEETGSFELNNKEISELFPSRMLGGMAEDIDYPNGVPDHCYKIDVISERDDLVKIVWHCYATKEVIGKLLAAKLKAQETANQDFLSKVR